MFLAFLGFSIEDTCILSLMYCLVRRGAQRQFSRPLGASSRARTRSMCCAGMCLFALCLDCPAIVGEDPNSYFLGLVGRSTAILGLLKFSSGLLRFSNVFGTCCIMLNLLDCLPFAWLLVGLPPVGLLLGPGAVSRVWYVLPSGGVGSVLPLSLGLSPLVGFACHRVFALAR